MQMYSSIKFHDNFMNKVQMVNAYGLKQPNMTTKALSIKFESNFQWTSLSKGLFLGVLSLLLPKKHTGIILEVFEPGQHNKEQFFVFIRIFFIYFFQSDCPTLNKGIFYHVALILTPHFPSASYYNSFVFLCYFGSLFTHSFLLWALWPASKWIYNKFGHMTMFGLKPNLPFLFFQQWTYYQSTF